MTRHTNAPAGEGRLGRKVELYINPLDGTREGITPSASTPYQ